MSAHYVVAIYDADNRCIAREVKFDSPEAAETHAQRKRDEIERRGWRMTVTVEIANE